MALRGLGRAGCYNMYVLIMLLATYLLNQLDRYMLAITAKPMAQEIHFGDKGCMVNDSLSKAETHDFECKAANQTICDSIIANQSKDAVCKWDFNGEGYEYQLVAGPVFILIYTFTGIFIGFAADLYNRKILLAGCLLLWSLMTLLTGFIKEYWQLVILRFGLGIGEAGCTPFAVSIIADIFAEELRGSALGVYNWGIYIGYSLSYAVGNFITQANINDQGWRWSFILPGIPGLVLGLVILATVKEPDRVSTNRKTNHTTQSDENMANDASTQDVHSNICQRLGIILKPFLCPSLLLLCVAGSVRNSAGYVWAYNAQPYFLAIGQSTEDIGKFMSWIPLVGGSLGVVMGGFISDRIVKRRGLYARVIVLVASQVLAAPFAAATLFFDPPWAYIFQIPTYIIGEMWVGVTLAVLVELVPSTIRTSSIAVYLFIISNIAGNVPLLVPLLQKLFENDGVSDASALRGALYILYPAPYVAGSALFLLTMFVLKRDQRRSQQGEYAPILGSEEEAEKKD